MRTIALKHLTITEKNELRMRNSCVNAKIDFNWTGVISDAGFSWFSADYSVPCTWDYILIAASGDMLHFLRCFDRAASNIKF